MKVAFIAQDSLSTLNFATWFALEFKRRGDVDMTTISSVEEMYRADIERLPARHIDVALPRFVGPWGDLQYIRHLRRLMRRERFDLVITFGTKPNVLAAIAAKLAGVPQIVVAVRGLGRLFANNGSPRDKILKRVLRLLYRNAARVATRVWFTNRYDRDYFVNTGLVDPAKTFLTRNSVNLGRFSPDRISVARQDEVRQALGLSVDQLVVIMVARLVWSKGVREFVEAAHQLQRHSNLVFVLVAPREGSADAIPEEFVQEMQREPNVKWIPYSKDIQEQYAIADIAVLPSYYKEGGYPRALLEPMALGKPVIAADTDDCRGPVEPNRNGFLVPPHDAHALADAIECLYLDAALRARFGRRSREIVIERFEDGVVGRDVLRECGLANVQ